MAEINLMSVVDQYLAAAERPNTRLSYASALRHFEQEWKGLLPATGEIMARYLADHASTLSVNTLRQRLAALSRWHVGQGFADPTKSPLVRQVLKGIRAVHPAQEKRARPLELDDLQRVDEWLRQALASAQSRGDATAILRLRRDSALLLLGFWRGFRADELVHLRIEHVQVKAGEGMTCYLGRSKGDRQMEGRTFRCPALSRLCPVAAYTDWIAAANLAQGPVFRKIDRWGHLADDGMGPNSLIPLLRGLFAAAGISASNEYSSHSLRRGFAGWARASGWDIKDLMEYVGWRDIKSAMRYLESSNESLQARFERGLPPAAPSSSIDKHIQPLQTEPDLAPSPVAESSVAVAHLMVTISLGRMGQQARGLARGHRFIEQTCLERFAMQRLDAEGTRYELAVPYVSRESLDETIYALLDDMYRVADANQCMLEASIHEPASGSYWD